MQHAFISRNLVVHLPAEWNDYVTARHGWMDAAGVAGKPILTVDRATGFPLSSLPSRKSFFLVEIPFHVVSYGRVACRDEIEISKSTFLSSDCLCG